MAHSATVFGLVAARRLMPSLEGIATRLARCALFAIETPLPASVPARTVRARRRLAPLALLVLAGCMSPDDGDITLTRRPVETGAAPVAAPLAPSPALPRVTQATAVRRSNTDLARDYLDLVFRLETGKRVSRLTRFDQPIRVALAPGAPATLAHDLDSLIDRLRREAGLDIARARPGESAAIRINVLPRAMLARVAPGAACFVVPNVTTWREFLAARGTGRLDWARLARREQAAIFIPADVAPQEARDCLQEELAQSLGPVNDLYRLGDSIFNDDNIHSVLTPFDMLMLRIHHDPALANGMSRAEVARRLPAILARLNPAGEGIAPAPLAEDPAGWKEAIGQALSPRQPMLARITAARRAARLADHGLGPRDPRTAFSHMVLGRLVFGQDPAGGFAELARARQIYLALYGPRDIHTAEVDLQLATIALARGDARTSLRLAIPAIAGARAAGNAALLSSLLMVAAEASAREGQMARARQMRLDSLRWARYGMGRNSEAMARLAAIRALSTRKPAG